MFKNSTKEVKLGEILRDAGLLSPGQLSKALQEQKTSGSSLVEVLTKKRYISRQNLVDVLTYEIPLPFGSKAPDKALNKLSFETGVATEEELHHLIDESELGKLLVQENYIKTFQLRLAQQEQQKTGLPLWRTLVKLGFMSPENINAILKEQMSRSQNTDLDELVGEILVNARQITRQQLEDATKQLQCQPSKTLGKVLTENNTISAASIATALGDYLNIPFIDLSQTDINEKTAKLLPEAYLRQHCILPISQENAHEDRPARLLLAVIDPLDIAVRDNVRMMTGCEVIPLLTTEKILHEKLEAIFSTSKNIQRSGPAESAPHDADHLPTSQDRHASPQFLSVELGDLANDGATVTLVTSLIEGAIRSNATDIHFEPMARGDLRVRYRVDGMLHDIMRIPPHAHPMVISRIKVLADMDITERRHPQDGHITMRIAEVEYYMRIGTLPTKVGERLVVRILHEGRVLTGLSQLGLEPDDLQLCEEFIATPYGMVLVTGPVGSGKTTTLYSALNEINMLTKNIITIEDPVEYQLPGINQVEVDEKVGLTFSAGLKAILRQDPNTLMVGEIRDPETAEVATRASLTGQQLFSTLHTQDAPGAIGTLSYLGVQPFWIASSLIGVIAQRLLRRICPVCKERCTPDGRLLRILGLEHDSGIDYYQGKGCDNCFHSGYSGRTGVFEVMKVDESLRGLIVQNAPIAQIKNMAIAQGMHTLRASGIRKIQQGDTTVEETLRVIL
ncbi:type II secretion system protein GspE [candidate division KSB3 bacterium]|uniref:Type II secretion system protein GspE n=1 Tax=candidate division KSB3 bacterium TaxID=2044937 RepID=A0A2G6E1G2_9BACT|nr:MAG: type II secretion system protein GspE [candidate division KSB3 bacterium]PIE28492.1 MAG: type II secretion system protein GspE [candidate division KSB3 bacterium]